MAVNIDPSEYKRLLHKYGLKEASLDGLGLGGRERQYLGLQYIEMYETKFDKEVFFPHTEKAKTKFLGRVEYDKEDAIDVNSGYFYHKQLENTMELPWLYFRIIPWFDIIVDEIYFSISNDWQGTSDVCVEAFDFTKSINTGKIGRNDEGKELVYFCNGIVIRGDGGYKFLNRAFTDPKEMGFGDKRFGLSRSSGNTIVISNSWGLGRDIRIPSYYEVSKFDQKMGNRPIKINLRAGFPNRDEMVTHSQRAYINHTRTHSSGAFNPSSEYSVNKPDLDPLYQEIFSLP